MAEHDDDLVIGAAAIARECFGGKVGPRQVYRLAETDTSWPIFKLLGKLTARRGPVQEEMKRRERRLPRRTR